MKMMTRTNIKVWEGEDNHESQDSIPDKVSMIERRSSSFERQSLWIKKSRDEVHVLKACVLKRVVTKLVF